MRKLKLVLEYDGSRYHGWQVQPNGVSIQEVLQKTVERITKQETCVIGSGRTDAGVHAEGQVAHFSTESNMTGRQFLKALNSLLPRDIVVSRVEEAAPDFDARRSAAGKKYRYTILNRDYPSAFAYSRSWYIPFSLDVEAMRQAARHLVGRHDFSAFRAGNCEARSPVREILSLDIRREAGAFIVFEFEGNGFLKYMVRNIVGSLVEVGKGRMAPDRIREILESRDRTKAGPTAQPQGLCLVEVYYAPDET
ncbi:MAG: tRNA pseudouridine(38-40) synthase TruA [Nitrospinae bacterium]|nr:tRNA pseudouridine(38-40) synthase TruA [Nitrospinota bacterium]